MIKENDMNNNTNNNSGNRSVTLEFCSNLTIAFIVLRLCEVIDWAWIWVMAPLWIPIAILILALILGMIAGGSSND